MGGSAISDENNNDAHSQSQHSHEKDFSLFSEGAPGSTDPIQWNNFLHKLTAKLKIDCSEKTEVDSVRTSYLPSRLNPGKSDKANSFEITFRGKATSAKLLNLLLNDAQLFGGKYIDTLHSSAENIRDAKETQNVYRSSFVPGGQKFDEGSRKRKSQETSNVSYNKPAKTSRYDKQDFNDRRGTDTSRNKQLFVCGKSSGRSTVVTLPQSVVSNNSRPVSTSDSEERFNFRFHKSSSFYRSKRDSCTQSRYKKGFYIRRGKFFVRKTCYRACPDKCRKSGLLQYNIHGTKKTRRSQTNSKFETTKPVCHTSSLQNGNPPIDSKSLKIGDWAVKLDLQDAYFHIPIHKHYRKFLRFSILGKKYQYRALPFGLRSAPRIFTKGMAVVGAFLRKQMIHIFMYLDDWMLKNSSKGKLTK
ncbi:Hypothetical predicted protein [Mytilus galloprovincialis]|uniref:Reverse transcriptase domain-containing protein n=1 Tax=Mytilus galloprovincialis TaxID=29158 RepID=A0A8B6DY51_MYTGA|nr:Hypothetical predicted protein [Mytilus galloprovincialis]